MGKPIDIKDLSGQVIFSSPINEGSKRKKTLQKEDYITLKFSLAAPIYFPIGCYVDDEEIGLFELTSIYNPTYNTETGGYDYELPLDAYYYKWKNKIFKYTPETGGQEASWSLTAGLDVHLGIFLRNLESLGYNYRGVSFSFSIDSTVENSAKLVSYDNTNMIDALSAMAEAWGCEWWIVDNVIHFGRCEYGTPVNFEIGSNVEEMTSSEGKNTYATRIYAFGSTRNIPLNYRPVDESIVVNGVVQRRLMLPAGTPYIDAYPNMPTVQAIEQVVVFDDIYPKTNGNINSVSTYDSTVENEDGTTTTETFYRFKDDGIKFSKDYILEGEELHIIFQSGSLNGMDFGVVFNPNGQPEKLENGSWNPDAQLWEIVANEDYGRKLPDDVLKPKVGDTYILYGWDSTKISDLGLISKAEQELKVKAEQYVEKSKVDPNSYTCKMMSDYMYGLEPEGGLNNRYSQHFDVGDRVNLVNSAYFKDGIRQSRIIGFEYSIDMPYDSPVYTVGETAEYSKIGDIEEKVDTLTLRGQTYTGGSGRSIYVIGTNDTTPATNRNVYSALRIKKEYVPFEGYVDQPVRKNDEVRFKAVYSDEIGSKNFVSGLLGEGYRIKNSHLEINEITVRKRMNVFELLIQKIRAVGGQIYLSPSSIKISQVEAVSNGYKCFFDTEDNTIPQPFIVNDLALCQTFTGKNTKRYWRAVRETGEDYFILSKSDCERNSDVPEAGDELILCGNKTEKERQSVIIISAYGVNAPYIDTYGGIDSFSMEGKLLTREGNLEGIIDEAFGQLTGQGIYCSHIYAKGMFAFTSGKLLEDELEEINTTLKITAEGIQQSVKKGDVISSINQSAEKIRISASRIELSGNTIFKDSSGGDGTIGDMLQNISDMAKNAKELTESQKYLATALQNDTGITGGLIASSLIKLGAVNSNGKWVEAAGISGIGTNENDVRFYAGGDLDSAIRLVNDTDGTKASFVVTHGGKLIATNVKLNGSFYCGGNGYASSLIAGHLALSHGDNVLFASTDYIQISYKNSISTISSGELQISESNSIKVQLKNGEIRVLDLPDIPVGINNIRQVYYDTSTGKFHYDSKSVSGIRKFKTTDDAAKSLPVGTIYADSGQNSNGSCYLRIKVE